jgi:hypothetical protein
MRRLIVIAAVGTCLASAVTAQMSEVSLDRVGTALLATNVDVVFTEDHAYCLMERGLLILAGTPDTCWTYRAHLYLPGRLDTAEELITYVSHSPPKVDSHVPHFVTDEGSALAVADGYAYAAMGRQGVEIIDVRRPTRPKWIARIDGAYYGVILREGLLGVRDSRRLALYDVSVPVSPQFLGECHLLGSTHLPGFIGEMAWCGDYVIVPAWDSGLCVVDVARPDSPFVTSTYNKSRRVRRVTVSGDTAFVAYLDHMVRGHPYYGLWELDVSDPKSPLRTRAYMAAQNIRDLAVRDRYAYLLEGDSVKTLDRTPAGGLQSVSAIQKGASQIDLVAGGAWVSDRGALVYLDLSDPRAPRTDTVAFDGEDPLIRAYGFPAGINDVAVQGNYAFLAADHLDLIITDLTWPDEPTPIAFYRSTRDYKQLVVRGNYVYATGRKLGLEIIDIAHRDDPRLCSRYDGVSKWAKIADLEQGYAYVYSNDSGVQIIDVRNPELPARAGRYVPLEGVNDLAVEGSRAYVATSGAGLQIVDVSDPQAPAMVGWYKPEERIARVTASDDSLAVIAWKSQLQVLGVSDPKAPIVLGTVNYSEKPWDLATDLVLRHDSLYVSSSFGVRLFRINPPGVPVEIAAYRSSDQSRALAVGGKYVYVADDRSLVVLTLNRR